MDELLLFLKKGSDPAGTRTLLRPEFREAMIFEDEGITGITLEFQGPQAHLVEGAHLKCVGEVQQKEPRIPHFIWRPFEHLGKVAYGWQDFWLHQPGSTRQTLKYSIQIVPSRLSLEHWNILFDDVRRVADALVTQWLNDQNPRVGGLALRATKFSPATAMAELKDGWEEFATSLNRITHNPRTEFRPASPQRPRSQDPDALPEPICDANIYENALVALTAERLEGTLRQIHRRAQATVAEADELIHTFYKHAQSKHAMEEAERTRDKSRQMASTALERATFLQRARNKLPVGRSIASARGRIPHVTPRIRHHPDYSRVIRWYRSFGYQRLAFSSQDFLSALGTRRASDIYEYWSLFALFSGLMELGYRAQFQHASELVREDVLDLELWSDRPISFTNEDSAETLTVWYERKARYLPGGTSIKAKAWRKHAQEEGPKAPPGLYSRVGPKEPDFWFELRRGGAVAVAVGDAIFSEGVDTSLQMASKDVLQKATKVGEYARDLILVEQDGKVVHPLEQGLVVFCGNTTHVDLLEKEDSTRSTFLALRPQQSSPGESSRPPSISLESSTLEILRDFLEDLRNSLPTPPPAG
jgi:hypothetical protein